MSSEKTARVQKTYETPCLKKVKPNEAYQFLTHHAQRGDPGAKELLALVADRQGELAGDFENTSREPLIGK